MAGAAQVEARVQAACQLLDDRLSHPDVARQLIHRFGVCRATAYSTITAAEQRLASSDDGPESTYDPLDADNLLAQLHNALSEAIALRDHKAAGAWMQMIDRAKRQHGYKLGG